MGRRQLHDEGNFCTGGVELKRGSCDYRCCQVVYTQLLYLGSFR